MAEPTLSDEVMRDLEELGPYSALYRLAQRVEDLDRRLEAVEGPVLHGRSIVSHATKETMP
jgi:hypothetical protein